MSGWIKLELVYWLFPAAEITRYQVNKVEQPAMAVKSSQGLTRSPRPDEYAANAVLAGWRRGTKPNMFV